MITAILIDDEKPALRELKFFWDAYSEISILGMYKNPLEAIAEVGERKPVIAPKLLQKSGLIQISLKNKTRESLYLGFLGFILCDWLCTQA